MDLLAKTENTTVLHSDTDLQLLAVAENKTVRWRDVNLSLLMGADDMGVASDGDAIGAGEASILEWTYDAAAPEGFGGDGSLAMTCVTSGTCRVWCVITWGRDNIHFWCDEGYTKDHISGTQATPTAMQGEYCDFKVKYSPINGDLDTETTTICEGCIYIPIYGEPNQSGGGD